MQVHALISDLQGHSAEAITLLNLVCCYLFIALFMMVGGIPAMYVYTVIAIIAANLQVLTAAKFAFYSEPVALGTVTYCSIFLVNDIIVQLKGQVAAKKNIYISFVAMIALLSLMLITLCYTDVNEASFSNAKKAIALLFIPNISILFASIISYICSQFFDITIFTKLKNVTSGRYLWLRIILSVALAALLDTLLFNLLAWNVFAIKPLPFDAIFNNYIVGAYIMQLIMAVCNVPMFYLILLFNKKQ